MEIVRLRAGRSWSSRRTIEVDGWGPDAGRNTPNCVRAGQSPDEIVAGCPTLRSFIAASGTLSLPALVRPGTEANQSTRPVQRNERAASPCLAARLRRGVICGSVLLVVVANRCWKSIAGATAPRREKTCVGA